VILPLRGAADRPAEDPEGGTMECGEPLLSRTSTRIMPSTAHNIANAAAY